MPEALAVRGSAPLPGQASFGAALTRQREQAVRARPAPLPLAAQAEHATTVAPGAVEAGLTGPAEGVLRRGERDELGPQAARLEHEEEPTGAPHAALPAAGQRLPLHRQAAVIAPGRAPGRRAMEVRTPSMAEAGAVLVQAAPEGASTQAPAGGGTQTGAPQGEAAPAASAEQPGGAPVDLDALARDVYRIICRRLRTERERSLGRRG